MFLRNEQAVIGQPFHLIIVLIITTIILGIFVHSILYTTQESQLHQVYHELNTIMTDATEMFEYADEGSMKTLHVEFPSSMHLLVFGALPLKNLSHQTNLTLQENTSNNYYVVMADGTIYTFHSNARFSGKIPSVSAMLGPGSYTIVLKLIRNEGKTYVQIYQQY